MGRSSHLAPEHEIFKGPLSICLSSQAAIFVAYGGLFLTAERHSGLYERFSLIKAYPTIANPGTNKPGAM